MRRPSVQQLHQVFSSGYWQLGPALPLFLCLLGLVCELIAESTPVVYRRLWYLCAKQTCHYQFAMYGPTRTCVLDSVLTSNEKPALFAIEQPILAPKTEQLLAVLFGL